MISSEKAETVRSEAVRTHIREVVHEFKCAVVVSCEPWPHFDTRNAVPQQAAVVNREPSAARVSAHGKDVRAQEHHTVLHGWCVCRNTTQCFTYITERVTRLNHEVFDHAVKDQPVVVTVATVRDEILDCFRTLSKKQRQRDVPQSGVYLWRSTQDAVRR